MWHRWHRANPDRRWSLTHEGSRAISTWAPSQTTGTALRVREMPFERAVTAHERDPFHLSIPQFRGTSRPCEPEKMDRDMLPAGKSVASRITHRRWTGGTALLSQRRGLRTEAEEEFGHIRLFRFASTFRATLSCCLLRIQQSTQYSPRWVPVRLLRRNRLCLCLTSFQPD